MIDADVVVVGGGIVGVATAMTYLERNPGASVTLVEKGALAGPDHALLSWRVCPLSGGRRMVLFVRAVPKATPASTRDAMGPTEARRATAAG